MEKLNNIREKRKKEKEERIIRKENFRSIPISPKVYSPDRNLSVDLPIKKRIELEE
jgi:hypothetical protein